MSKSSYSYEAMLYHLVRFKRKYAEPVDLYRKIPNQLGGSSIAHSTTCGFNWRN